MSKLVLAIVNPLLPRERQCVEGSEVVTADCGHQCWLSPQGRPYLQREGITTSCILCAEELIENPETEAIVVKGGPEAFRRDFGVAAADQVAAVFRDRGWKEDE